MPSNSLGRAFRITTFGESHGPAIGVVIDGVRPGLQIDLADIASELERRRPGKGNLVSPRNEPDIPEILSGVFEGRTTGAPICILVRNRDARSRDYADIKDVFRPGHADWTWVQKYGIRDYRGGGRASGRETAARVMAGAVARKVIESVGMRVGGSVMAVGEISTNVFSAELAMTDPTGCGELGTARKFAEKIAEVAGEGDSIGGIVEIRAVRVLPGLGDPVFDKLDAALASALMSIGGVKGVEIGDGFAVAHSLGSFNNDQMAGGGFTSNHAGGIIGGISTGQDIVVRIAVKPTPSIAKRQTTVDVLGNERDLEIIGRHDPCLCIRILPVAESMVACVLADAYMAQGAVSGRDVAKEELEASICALDRELNETLLKRIAIARKLGSMNGPGGVGVQNDADSVMEGWRRRTVEAGEDFEKIKQVIEKIISASN